MADIVEFPAKKAGGRLCVDCGEQIHPKRLRAQPDARRCTGCAHQRALDINRAEMAAGNKGIVIIKG